MKTKRIIILITLTLLLSSCSPSVSPTPAAVETGVINTPVSKTQTPYPLLKTSMEDFVVVSAHLVDEVPDMKAPPGGKFLLVELERPNLEKLVFGEFPLESFRNMLVENNDEIYVLGNDGSKLSFRGMCGWFKEDVFAFGFEVSQPLPESYTLYWPGNSPIELNIEK